VRQGHRAQEGDHKQGEAHGVPGLSTCSAAAGRLRRQRPTPPLVGSLGDPRCQSDVRAAFKSSLGVRRSQVAEGPKEWGGQEFVGNFRSQRRYLQQMVHHSSDFGAAACENLPQREHATTPPGLGWVCSRPHCLAPHGVGTTPPLGQEPIMQAPFAIMPGSMPMRSWPGRRLALWHAPPSPGPASVVLL